MADSIIPVEGVCEVAFEKKEFAIVGDAFFASTLAEVPAWLQEAVTGLTTSLNSSTLNTLSQYNINLQAALAAVNVSKNTYDQYINKVITDDQAFVDTLTTLNSTIAGNDASIRNLLLTYATKTEVTASIANAISASLSGGSIGAALNTIDSTIATQYGALTQRFTALESTFFDNATQQAANAAATQALETYTGYGVIDGSTPQLLANTSFYTNLTAYLTGSNWTTGGTSTLVSDLQATANSVESKYAYNSTVSINGSYYKTGFGIDTSATMSGTGTTTDPFTSEFWIRADSFRVKDSLGNTHIYWDATNDVINFTGTVAASTVIGSSITGNTITGGTISGTTITGTAINGNTITGGIINGTTINGTTINGSTVNAGFLTAGVFDVSSLKVQGPTTGNYGPLSFTMETNWAGSAGAIDLYFDTIVSPSWGSGYHGKRLRAFNSILVTQMTLFGDYSTINAYLQVSYDGGGYNTIYSMGADLDYRSGETASRTIRLMESGWTTATLRWRINNARTSGVVQYFSSLISYNAGME